MSDVLKALCLDIPAACPGFAMIAPIRGANESTQYVQRLGYTSLFSTARSEIKIEFGVREELIMRPLSGEAQTLLLNPLTGDSWVEPFRVRVMARDEMWSEKARAALCRREPAIRDFYDMDFGLRSGQVDIADPRFVSLVRRKTSVPGNKLVKMTEERRAELERQKNAELRAVLRGRDFERFDLGRIWDSLTELSGRL